MLSNLSYLNSINTLQIEVLRRKNEPIPLGWAQGPDGKPTTDAELALKTSALMPLGGAEITSGFKGYALALMVETFCGMLGGEYLFSVSSISKIK